MSKLSKEIKYLNVNLAKPATSNTESTLNNVEEERDSPDAIIKFINKKIIFKSKFDRKGSEEFLSSKDIALCNVILDDEIEEECECYNNLNFMRQFTFNRGNNPNSDEKNLSGKNQKSNQLNHGVSKQHKLNENNSHLDAIGKNKENKTRKKL